MRVPGDSRRRKSPLKRSCPMKFVFALAAVLLLAGGFNFTAIESASAQCAGPSGAVLVPPPNPIPMRRLVVRPLRSRSRHAAPVTSTALPPMPHLRLAAKAAAAARPSSISRSGSMPIGSSPATPPAIPDPGIAIGAGTAGTIRSDAASAIRPGRWRVLTRVAARPMQRDRGRIRDVEARQRARASRCGRPGRNGRA